MFIVVFQTLFAALVLLCTFVYFKYRKTYTFWSSRGIKGPTPIPFFGNALSCILKSYPEIDEINFKKYGKTYGTYDGVCPVLITSDTNLIQDIWIKNFSSFGGMLEVESPDALDRNVIVNVLGSKWKRIRTVLSATFSTAKIRDALTDMTKPLDKFCNHVDNIVAKNEPIDARELFACLTMDLTIGAFYSMETDSYSPENPFVENAKKMLRLPVLDLLLMENLPYWVSSALGLGFTAVEPSLYLRNVVLQLIENRKKGGAVKQDMLQLLMESQDPEAVVKNKGLEEIEVMANAATLLGGAFDTMTSAISFVAYRLAQNTKAQEKVYAEVVGVVGNGLNRRVNYDDTKLMPYLEAALNEAMRMNSVIFRGLRFASEDTVLPGTNISLPKGTKIHVPTYLLHHDPDYFSEPHLFKPERFLPESGEKIVNGSFMPFGLGPRQCVAMRFAMASMKQSFSEIIRRYEFIPAHENTQPLKLPCGNLLANEVLIEVKMKKRC